MNKNIRLFGLYFTTLMVLSSVNAVNAKNTINENQINNTDVIKSQNSRQTLPHSQRKAAALRLKQTHNLENQSSVVNKAQSQSDTTGNGKRGAQ